MTTTNWPLSHPDRLRKLPVVCLLLCFAAGCREAPKSGGALLIDSAGIRIVSSSRQSLDSIPGILFRNIDLELGSISVESEYEFYDVRGAVQMPDGGVAVLNAGTQQVRFYDNRGEHIRSHGRPGRGPGEFRFPLSLQLGRADSVLVFDGSLRRFTVIPRSDGEVRTLNANAPLSGVVGLLSTNIVVLNEPIVGKFYGPGVRTTPQVVRILALETGRIDTIAVLGKHQEYHWIEGDHLVTEPVPYTVYAKVQLAGNEIYVTDCVDGNVRIYDARGGLKRIVRVTGRPEEVRAADVQQYVRHRIRQEPEQVRRDRLQRILGEIGSAPFKPLCDAMLITRDRHIWLRRFRSSPSVEQRWLVFDETGHGVATAVTPAGLKIFDAGDDFILGVISDSLGVEMVRRYRPGRAP